LQLPEVIGEKVDKRTLRKTGRTEQFATRVSKEWLEQVKGIAEKENLKLVEVLERMLENYQNHKKPVNSPKVVQENFSEKLLITEQKKTIQSVNNYPSNELFTNTCSFFLATKKEIITCEQPLFDKKKQLCRSHNRQVRKRFNEFTKDMSVSSTAAWEMSWEQSNDWKYF
jgi:hypothetical protein